jgi:DNA helicase-2/ATP-dependent DNA helicase PcrA
VATQPAGPAPSIRRFADGDAELAHIVGAVRALIGGGTPATEVAVLVRINAQVPPIEAALTKARIPFRVRGQRFFERPEVRDALRLLRRLATGAGAADAPRGSQLLAALDARLRADLGFEGDTASGPSLGGGAEARERTANLALVLEIAGEAVAARHDIDVAGLAADFDARAAAEAEGSGDGVNLLTFHRAKGLEWDAVLLPQLEEGTLPIRQADSDEEIAEERRLLYVGLTRARRHLSLSWAERREARRRPSRFLAALEDRPARSSAAGRVTVLPGAPMNAGRAARARDDDSPLMAALREWRTTTARSDGVPAYVVAADALLIEIADRRPTTMPALGRIKGIGPSKLARYGEEILEITRADR